MNNHYKLAGAIIIEGHVQGLSNTRSLGEAGIPVYVLDKTNCLARYSRYCKKFFYCPDFAFDELAEFLIDLAEKENIRDWLLLPSNDHAVMTIARNHELLSKYYKLITPPDEFLQNIVDKTKLLGIAKEAGVPVPKSWTFRTKEEALKHVSAFPVLTRGRLGLSFYKTMGRKAFLSRSRDEFLSHLQAIESKMSLSSIFSQELIPAGKSNPTISYAAFCVNGEVKTFWMGEKLREHPWQFGTATMAQSMYVEKCHEQSVSLLKALNYNGICEVEYLLDLRTGEYKLIEINARTWLWVGLARACGVDFAKTAWERVNNQPIDYPKDYITGLKWRNLLTDTWISIWALARLKMGFMDYLKSLRGKIIPAVYSRKDPLPAFMIFLLALYLARKRNILR